MRKLIGNQNHIAQYDLREFKGRVFFVTDVHGHYDLLHQALRDVAFNSETDLLFSGGDWTDRGPDSQHVLDYLNEPWIHSVRGNHEELFCGAVDENWEGRNSDCLFMNGVKMDYPSSTETTKAIYDTFKSLPLGIELLMPRGRKIGIVHAEVPGYDWEYFKQVTKAELEWNEQAVAQWARRWYDRGFTGQVAGVDFVLVGHTPTDSGDTEKLGNMVFCDGGSFFRKKINLIEINDEFMRRVSNVA